MGDALKYLLPAAGAVAGLYLWSQEFPSLVKLATDPAAIDKAKRSAPWYVGLGAIAGVVAVGVLS